MMLQCGRIYKDAEIQDGARLVAKLAELQCGRIYKDAEIKLQADAEKRCNDLLQCGRIYKDAEIQAPGGSPAV